MPLAHDTQRLQRTTQATRKATYRVGGRQPGKAPKSRGQAARKKTQQSPSSLRLGSEVRNPLPDKGIFEKIRRPIGIDRA